MKLRELPHSCDKFYLDGGYVSRNNYVVINDRNEVFRNGRLIRLAEECSLGHPKVQIISPEYFLLIDSDKDSPSEDRVPNAWVVNNEGGIEKSFYLGPVHRVIVTKNNIVCSYTDSVLFTNSEFGKNGLVVFDMSGKSLFEYYRDEKEDEKLNWIENYAFLAAGKHSVYYLPLYTCAIIELSLIDFSSKIILELPKAEELKNDEFWNPKAFSKKGDDWIFITPGIDRLSSRIFLLNPKGEVEEIGRCCFSGFPKGKKGGKFFVPFSGGPGKDRKCQNVEV